MPPFPRNVGSPLEALSPAPKPVNSLLIKWQPTCEDEQTLRLEEEFAGPENFIFVGEDLWVEVARD